MSTKRPWDDLEPEIQFHIEQETRENIERGMPPDAARSAALRKFGNLTRVQEETRAVWSIVWLEQWIQDLRYGARMLRRNPGFTAVVVATLALGIGMNTAVFSVVNTVMFHPLPYPNADRLMWLGIYSFYDQRDIFVARPDYLAWKDQARSFEKMAAYGDDDLALVSGGQASEERIASIAGDFWTITAATPALGRLFRAAEPNALVLSWALFERRFHSDPNVIGKSATLNGFLYTIAGVLPKDYRFAVPQQYIPGDEVRDIDAYIAIPDAIMAIPSPTNYLVWESALGQLGPSPYAVHVVGLLRPGISPAAAHAEMQALFDRIAKEYPDFTRKNTALSFRTLHEKVVGDARRALLVLLVAVAFVLLIACVNIANLLLARAAKREREIAIRTSLGAGRMRMIRQFLTESLLLALSGGGAGLLLARWGLTILKRLGPQAVPGLTETTIDAPVLWFTLAVSIATGFLFGLGPAIHKSDAARSLAGGRRFRLRELLVAAELALAIVLLAGAGLMLKSFWRMKQMPAGFTPENILVMRITLSGPAYGNWPPKQTYTDELLRRLESLPGVLAAGIDGGVLHTNVRVDGVGSVVRDERPLSAAIRGVSPHYLRALGTPLVKGTWPPEGSVFGVVTNQAFARQLPGIDLTGRRISVSILNDTIAGVVADFKIWQLDANPLPEIYMPYERMPGHRSMKVAVRTAGSAAAMASAVRGVISGLDPTQPPYEFQTLEQSLSDSIAPRRFNLFLLGTFAATALVLALIGISGVIAYSVAQRTREIGIRLALGARRGEIVGMVVRQGMAMALAGIAIGIAAALGLTRLMASLLYDVKPNDPWTYAAVSVALAATSLLAAWAPALKAALVDPLIALRYE